MKKWIMAVALLAFVPWGRAQGIVPNGLALTEGNSSMSDVFNSSSFRMQIVINASQFSIPAGMNGRVDSLWLRIDSATSQFPTMFFGGGSVTLSTTPVGADGLSTTFANNIGANPVTIFNGAFSVGGTLEAGSPQAFRETIRASAPFLYNPQQGNLLVDIIAGSGQAFIPGAMDAQDTVGDGVSRVYSLAAGSLTGTADSLGLLMRFNMTVIPEPASWMLGILGLVAFGILRRFAK